MITQLPIVKGDKVGNETDYRDALPVNMSAVAKPILGAAGYMIQDPGLTLHGTTTGTAKGGVWNEEQSKHFRVHGTDLVSVGQNGAITTLGTVQGTGTVSLPYSFNTQGVVSGGSFYLYDAANGFRQVTDPDMGSPIDCVWVDGYYFFTDGQYIYHTNITDETAIDPLKFATAEFMPDPSLGVGKTQDNKVIVFGRYSTEYFVNAATENFAFQRVATRAIKIGIVGTHAKCEAGDAWFILGGRKEESISIHRLGVGSAEKIATREIDKILGEYSETELQASVVESYDEDGSTFIIVHLSNHVLKFNLTLALGGGTQHAWSILNTGVTYSPWRGKHGVFDPRLGKWVFGDKLSGKVGILDSTVATQYDQIAEWVLFTPFANFERQSIDEFGIETIPGFTTTDDATVFLSMTTDGVSYGMEKTIPYGAPNIYTKRFVVRRLGYVSSWIGFKLRGATRSRTAFALARVTHG